MIMYDNKKIPYKFNTIKLQVYKQVTIHLLN